MCPCFALKKHMYTGQRQYCKFPGPSQNINKHQFGCKGGEHRSENTCSVAMGRPPIYTSGRSGRATWE